jgi:catalase
VLTPEAAVDRINERFGRHAGCRSLHAKGVVCRGSFTASADAARLTRAAHMQGETVEATVRFSNGSGDPGEPEYLEGVRGLAVKFYLPDGSRTDVSAQTVPRFPVRTPEAFIELVEAAAPGLSRVWKLPLFLIRHREALPALRDNAWALKPAPSYANAAYYAIHAFKWIDADGGVRYVRYTWIPEAGDERLAKDDAKSRGPDYLEDEIRERLDREPVRFTLRLQVAADGDRTDDPTAVWPGERETVDAGVLEVTGLDTERETGDDVLVFDPMRLTDGIEASGDPVLRFRPAAYSESVERRT